MDLYLKGKTAPNPGLIDTGNIRRFFPADERKEFAGSEIPLGNFGQRQDRP
ncbi:hypothetical protein [Dyadobacter pollutisoli]|jgi:3-oxoacyl-[acyl-carrier protein] reductase|uniref:Uncharacterized protein n=1 Tax=Dyadobacter pollutisoli TaxID=2910158 RepID=A0A9E8NCE5_9BACT|nr:hypothetical protein [Dyadobacter pollutisoli]WAC14089.1 hypothetical protein ON006_09020 [Dyadobacter pollutisoli]